MGCSYSQHSLILQESVMEHIDHLPSPTITVVTAGANYLDIDAYACCVAMRDLLILKGENAIAYSKAEFNYSVCQSLVEKSHMQSTFPANVHPGDVRYIIVDVSDPAYIQEAVSLDSVTEVYDHHVGYEDYWLTRIGAGAHIEFVGAAATLIYREWKKANLQEQIKKSTARLLAAAILDNTLDLMSSNTTEEDIEAYSALSRRADVDEMWRATYFSEVQANVEKDLYNALRNDLKHIDPNPVLPSNIAQLCVWDAGRVMKRLPDIHAWFAGMTDGWMLNLIDIHRCCSYFICDDIGHQKEIERLFDVRFEASVAHSAQAYLRKQILKKVQQ